MTREELIQKAGAESARLAKTGTQDGWLTASAWVRVYNRAAVAARAVGLPEDHATLTAVLDAEARTAETAGGAA